jgi:hypothetical protein
MRGWRLPLSLIASVVGLVFVVDSESSLPPVKQPSTVSTAARDASSRNDPVDRGPVTCQASMTESTKVAKYEQDGAEAREIAAYLPYFPFKGIDRFYDIGGFLYEPAVFRRIVNIFADRYREIGIDVVAGYVFGLQCELSFVPILHCIRFVVPFGVIVSNRVATNTSILLLSSSCPSQIGCPRVYFGSSHCIGTPKAVCHDA